MSLTDVEIRNVSGNGKVQRFYDERGLYLEVAPRGGKWWRFKYRLAGKEKRISLGVYPEVSLKDARLKCADARKLLSDGIDPSQNRKEQEAAMRGPAKRELPACGS